MASAQAQLARAEANRKAAERTLERNRTLFNRNTVSRAVFDDAQSAFDIAAADAQIAEANLDAAKLNLSYAAIHAPISGRIGRAAFTMGNLVGPDSGSLARIVSLDPIRVAFSMDEGLLITIRQRAAGGDALRPEDFELTLQLANGTEYSEDGRIEFIEHQVDPQTGTSQVRAIFANPASVLLPGQFVTLLIAERNPPRLPVVPQTAVLQDREGRFVYVVGDDNVASVRRIETGVRLGNTWAVETGLEGGERVVVQGSHQLAEGMTVQPSDGLPADGGT